MTDERFVYETDIKDRKRTASGARAKKGGSRSRRCSLPSDKLSKAQQKKLNGSVESIKLNMPMDHARFKELTPTLQFLYLDHLINEYNARRVDLCLMLGVATCTFWKLQQWLQSKLVWKYNKKKPAPEWEAFMAAGYQNASTPTSPPETHQEPMNVQETFQAVSSPVVLAGSVTAHCTASAVLDVLLRLIDDPAQEYTFTIQFSKQ